jgi:hypothetical protein
MPRIVASMAGAAPPISRRTSLALNSVGYGLVGFGGLPAAREAVESLTDMVKHLRTGVTVFSAGFRKQLAAPTKVVGAKSGV